MFNFSFEDKNFESSAHDGALTCEVSEGNEDFIGPFVRRLCGIWIVAAVISNRPEPPK